jgi:hypothetical protein
MLKKVAATKRRSREKLKKEYNDDEMVVTMNIKQKTLMSFFNETKNGYII